ncbi:MAG: biopolymer transporter ExbD [Pseudomonadota bacterium]
MKIRRSREAADILNITPLIDVVFILLVFFMIATNFASYRLIRIETPRETEVKQTSEGAIVIAIAEDGSLTFDSQPIARAALRDRIADVVAIDPGRAFLVRPAPGVKLQEAIAIFDEARAAGARAVSFSGSTEETAGDGS